ncbi:MAG: NifB/NifX family molybdenum-iron cluster-binding protein [Intestinibacillus sp.]
MKIAVPTENGSIFAQLGQAKEFTVVTVSEDGRQFEKEIVPARGDGVISVVSLMAERRVDALICGELGLMARSAFEMIEIELVPGCEGPADEAISKYLAGEKQGDPSILSVEVEMDENDPMRCMHDCSKCGGCGTDMPVPEVVKKRIPEV